jgi:hypothetical protein
MRYRCTRDLYWNSHYYKAGTDVELPDGLQLPVSKTSGPFFIPLDQAPPLPPKPRGLDESSLPGKKARAKKE